MNKTVSFQGGDSFKKSQQLKVNDNELRRWTRRFHGNVQEGHLIQVWGFTGEVDSKSRDPGWLGHCITLPAQGPLQHPQYSPASHASQLFRQGSGPFPHLFSQGEEQKQQLFISKQSTW